MPHPNTEQKDVVGSVWWSPKTSPKGTGMEWSIGKLRHGGHVGWLSVLGMRGTAWAPTPSLWNHRITG